MANFIISLIKICSVSFMLSLLSSFLQEHSDNKLTLWLITQNVLFLAVS